MGIFRHLPDWLRRWLQTQPKWGQTWARWRRGRLHVAVTELEKLTVRFETKQEALLGRMDALLMSVDRVIATAMTNSDRPNPREVRALLASYRDHLARAIADGDIDEQLKAIAGMSGVNKGLSDTYWASDLLDVRQLGYDLSNAANEAGASLRREHDREVL